MTPSQLERAARHYCKLMGVDPEQLVVKPNEVNSTGFSTMECSSVPRWTMVAKELHSFWAMNEALKEGMLEDGDLIAESPST